MTKDRSKNVAASVRARLLKIARENGEDFQLVPIRFALERMLFRLSKSEHANDLVLKGAILFQVWSGESHRPTRDVDLLGHCRGYRQPNELQQRLVKKWAVERLKLLAKHSRNFLFPETS